MPLVLCATPLGNLGDASPRLAATLAGADIVAAEDTRRFARLARELGVTTRRVVSLYDANEVSRSAELLVALRDGMTVALVTDAGMPTVSDPGFRLVRAAADAGIDVTVVPGPSAVTAALAVSGLPTDRWCVEGFLPRRAGERRTRLAALAAEPRTIVFFEAPHRLAAMLRDTAAAFGEDRSAAVCRELTKTYEEVRRGALRTLADWAEDGVRGEVTVVVGGASALVRNTPERDKLVAEVSFYVDSGHSRRDAVDAVAATHGLSRREVYSLIGPASGR